MEHSSHSVPVAEATPGQLHLLDLFLAIAVRKKFVLRFTTIAMVLALGLSFLLKNNYESSAVILPPHQDQSVSGLLSGQLGSLSALGGGGGGLASAALGLKNPNEIYSGLLLSRTVSSRLVQIFDLKTRFKKKTEEDAIKALLDRTQIDLGKSSLIRITVTTHDPLFSSQLANAYVDQLHELNTTLALTDSSQRRSFYQQQLDQEKVLLANAEADFQQVQKKTGILQPTGQADLIARNIASIRAEITARSAQLRSLGVFATAENPDYQKLQSEISSLQAQLASSENSTKSATPGDIEVPTAKLPESTLEYTRKLRELRLQETVYELLTKQFEAAKIDEAKTAPLIQIVDRAVPAQRKSGPPRTLIVLGTGIAAFIAAVLWFVVAFFFTLLRQDVEFGPKIALLRSLAFGSQR